MNVQPLIPLQDQIAAERAAERRRCLTVIEELNIAISGSRERIPAQLALCMAHGIINKLYGDQPK